MKSLNQYDGLEERAKEIGILEAMSDEEVKDR